MIHERTGTPASAPYGCLCERFSQCIGLDADPESPINHLLGSSITYRIAIEPQQGRKVFTLQTLPVNERLELTHINTRNQ